MILSSDTRYNNIEDGIGVYAVGQPLLLGIGLQNSSTKPTYVKITSSGVSIENLEMCRINSTTDCIDLAPFIQSYLNFNEKIFDLSSTTLFQRVFVNITNEDETEGELNISFYAYKYNTKRGKSPMIAGAPLTTPASSEWPTGTYVVDTLLNDFSPIYLPNCQAKYARKVTFALNDSTLTSAGTIMSIPTTATEVELRKNTAQGYLIIGHRPIVRKNLCPGKTIMVQYLSKYGSFEYFFFDTHYNYSIDVEKSDRLGNYPENYATGTLGNIYEKEVTKTINASVLISDDIMQDKFIDLISSRKVFLYDGDYSTESINKAEDWVEVDLNCQANFKTKSKSRQTVEIVVKNSQVW